MSDGYGRDGPHDLEAEIAVLGSLMLLQRPEDAKAISDLLLPMDFFHGPHNDIFRVQTDLWECTAACDIVLLRNALIEDGSLEAIGGSATLSRIVASVPSTANALHYARIVRRKSLERRVLDRTEKHRQATLEHGNGLADKAFENLREAQQELSDFIHAPVKAASGIDFLDALEQPEPPEPPMFVDRLFIRKSLNTIFGPPASGKSWSAMSLGLDAATTGGYFLGAQDLAIRLAETGLKDRVLWAFGAEDTANRVIRRLKKLYGHGDPDFPLERGHLVFQTPPDGILLNSPLGWRWLNSLLDTHTPTVLILDTVTSLCAHTLDVNKAEEVVPFMQRLLAMRTQRELTIFLIHHTSKPAKDAARSPVSKAASMLGSQAWLSLSESVLMLDAKDGNTADVTVRCVKTKDIPNPIPPFRVCLDEQTGRFSMLDEEQEAPERAPVQKAPKGGRKAKFSADTVLALREKYPEGLKWNAATVCGELKFSERQFYDRCDEVLTELQNRRCALFVDILNWPN